MQTNESGVLISTSLGSIKAFRPEPITENVQVFVYKHRMDPQLAADAITEGYFVLVNDFYSNGLAVLNKLKQYITNKYPGSSFSIQREARAAYRELSHRLLLKISGNKLVVRKAPEIGWFKILYPGLNQFLLPFPQVQGLNSSWQWYEKGIYIKVAGRKIHPLYGTYFPTRFEHLELFDNWLKQYRGNKETAIDVGIGSGVLAFQMLKYGFGKVVGIDSNPNAIIGLDQYLIQNQLNDKIALIQGDLLMNCKDDSELIVFNPPWLPVSANVTGMDSAIYYDDQLFDRFFTQAADHLKPGGRVVILFSNLAQISYEETHHPIEQEILSGGRFQKVLLVQKQVRSASDKTKRNLERRSSELVELWVLRKVV